LQATVYEHEQTLFNFSLHLMFWYLQSERPISVTTRCEVLIETFRNPTWPGPRGKTVDECVPHFLGLPQSIHHFTLFVWVLTFPTTKYTMSKPRDGAVVTSSNICGTLQIV